MKKEQLSLFCIKNENRIRYKEMKILIWLKTYKDVGRLRLIYPSVTFT
jgi:hypothetical protein